jgi:hypothetical protein
VTRLRFSPHFVVEEFDCRDGTRVPDSPRLGMITGISHLVQWWLEPMRAQFGPVHIVSGYRTLSHNTAVGGASRSVHLGATPLLGRTADSRTVAMAADVVCRRARTSDVFAWAQDHVERNEHLAARARGGIGYYPRGGFIHVDTAGRREWRG